MWLQLAKVLATLLMLVMNLLQLAAHSLPPRLSQWPKVPALLPGKVKKKHLAQQQNLLFQATKHKTFWR